MTDTLDTVDQELDRLISRRVSQDRRPDPDEREEPWKESVRAYNARREEVRSARVEYHRGQAVRLRTVLETPCRSKKRQMRNSLDGAARLLRQRGGASL